MSWYGVAGPCTSSQEGLRQPTKIGSSSRVPYRRMQQWSSPTRATTDWVTAVMLRVVDNFNALVEDLVKSLNSNNVPSAAQQALLGALAPLQSDIVVHSGSTPDSKHPVGWTRSRRGPAPVQIPPRSLDQGVPATADSTAQADDSATAD